MTKQLSVDTELMSMLTYKRPTNSKEEKLFINTYIKTLSTVQDGYGNEIIRVGNAPILWSCHTDTVHCQEGKQKVIHKNGIISLPHNTTSNCLGADDTVGVWLMRNMIKRGVEGLYIFHRAEEVGGCGSTYLVQNHSELFSDIKCAIALDRYGTGDVITFQGGRCCSNDFALSLCDQLDMTYSPCDRGIFTDTANYVHLIPECTNISVGYYNEHTIREYIDYPFARTLLEKLCSIDWKGFVIRRDVLDSDYYGRQDTNHYSNKYKNTYDLSTEQDELYNYSLEELCALYPDTAAMIMGDMGYNRDDFIGLRNYITFKNY